VNRRSALFGKQGANAQRNVRQASGWDFFAGFQKNVYLVRISPLFMAATDNAPRRRMISKGKQNRAGKLYTLCFLTYGL
jgi:hypothetical protein